MNSNVLYLHFDSLTSTYTTDPFQTTFKLNHPIKNVKNIYLSSCELPLGFYNIRSDNGSNTFTLTIGSSTQSVTLTPANYTSCTALCSSLTTAFASPFSSNPPTFSVSGSNVVITVGTSAIISITSNTLSQILGFSSNQSTTTSAVSLTASGFYNLAIDSYIGLAFTNLPVYNQTTNYSFKIQLNGSEGTLIFSNSNAIMSQALNFASKDFIISYFSVKFFDRFGYQILTNNGLHWSFSLMIEYYNDEIGRN
jgi:hypothetical protein